MPSAAIREDDVLPYAEIFSLPVGLYVAWQIGYWFIIEVSTVYILKSVPVVWLKTFYMI